MKTETVLPTAFPLGRHPLFALPNPVPDQALGAVEEERNLGKSGVWPWRHLGNVTVELTYFYENNSVADPSTL